MKMLDVGCGAFPQGDVNVDFDIQTAFHHRSYVLNSKVAKAMPNFVLADAYHLPFPNKTFSRTKCFHTLEHVKHPLKLIKELIRVTRGIVIIKCPHRYWRPQRESHVQYFNVKWFAQALRGYIHRAQTRWQTYRNIPFFFIPCEITVGINTEARAQKSR